MIAPDSYHIGLQVIWLFVLGIPVSCLAWTVTHEEVFREPREYCQRCSADCRNILARKFFYLFTCEYCFSHYISAFFLLLTGFHLLLDDWRGYFLGFFALVWVSNIYMNFFSRLRVDIRSERATIEVKEKEIEAKQIEIDAADSAAGRPIRPRTTPGNGPEAPEKKD